VEQARYEVERARNVAEQAASQANAARGAGHR
jgi:hypothetical protein